MAQLRAGHCVSLDAAQTVAFMAAAPALIVADRGKYLRIGVDLAAIASGAAQRSLETLVGTTNEE